MSSGPGADGVPDRRHHIRVVADHFLSVPDAQPVLPVPPVAGDDRRFRFAVAAADHGFLAAWVTAGLAAASLGLAAGGRSGRVRVTLEEWHRQPWVAEPFLGGSDREHVRALFRPQAYANGARPDRHWLGGVEFLSPRLGDEPDGSGGGAAVCSWVNLGALSCTGLAALEAVRSWDGGAPLAGGVDGLVWCVREEEARVLGPAYRLGRLVLALAPRQLKVLVFGAGAATPALAAESRARCLALVGAAAPAMAAEAFHGVPDPRRGAAPSAAELLARVAASLALGAATARQESAATLARKASA